jgi:hypothetical protein
VAEHSPSTGAGWLSAMSPYGMLRHLRHGRGVTTTAAGRRRLRLFCVACCRSVWEHLDESSRHAVEVAERFADGRAPKAELAAAHERAVEAHRSASETLAAMQERREALPEELAVRVFATRAAEWTAGLRLADATEVVAHSTVTIRASPLSQGPGRPPGRVGRQQEESSFQAGLLRCLFRSPFWPAAADGAWITGGGGTVTRLARAIYDERAFGRLPVLADALEEAGCTDPAVLVHCRGGGPHARGCWVVDALLGKASTTCAPPDAGAVSGDDRPADSAPDDGAPRLRLYRPE